MTYQEANRYHNQMLEMIKFEKDQELVQHYQDECDRMSVVISGILAAIQEKIAREIMERRHGN